MKMSPAFRGYFEIPRLIQGLEGVNMYVNLLHNISVSTVKENRYFMPFTHIEQYYIDMVIL